MNAPEKSLLHFVRPDMQGTPDHRNPAISLVGNRGLHYPIQLVNSAGKIPHTIATVTMAAGLPPSVNGTHKPRLIGNMEVQDRLMTLNQVSVLLDGVECGVEANV